MTPHHCRHRQNGHKIPNAPIPRHRAPLPSQPTQHHHPHNPDARKRHAEFEPARNFGDFEEEVGGFDFFGGGGPGDGVGEEVAEEGRADVEAEAAKEEGEEEGVPEVEEDYEDEGRGVSGLI